MAIQPPLSAGDGRLDTTPPPDRRPLVSVSEYTDAVRAVLTGGERARALRILHDAGIA